MVECHFIREGALEATAGITLRATLPLASLGDECTIHLNNDATIQGQIVSFEGQKVWISPTTTSASFSCGMKVTSFGKSLAIEVGANLLGSVIDATGRKLEGGDGSYHKEKRPIYGVPPEPLNRSRITSQLLSGIRVIDAFVALGFGQRIGVFAPAGIGKSTLMGMIAKQCNVDIVVVALVGERGREVRDFLEDNFPETVRKRSIIVVATSDESALRRAQAPLTATTVAEYFRDKGNNVLLIVDSLTRTARALREIGLSTGEQLVRGGYTSSVYAHLPILLERAGQSDKGSITALYTMLSSSDENEDPLADEIKSLLDGHITLCPEYASKGIYPALDPLKSLSRLSSRFLSNEERACVASVRKCLARLKQDRDIITFGGTPDAELSAALKIEPEIFRFLSQDINEISSREGTMKWLSEIATLLM